MKTLMDRLIRYFRTDIWRIRLRDLSRGKALLVGNLRVLLAAGREFAEHRGPLQASALTFYTLLSIVPVVALAFGIAKGFDFQSVLQQRLLEKFPGQEEILTNVFSFANSLLARTKGGLVAGVGVGLLFWTIIKLVGNIENALNVIWGVRKDRSLSRKITDYLSVMFVAPVLLVVSGSATVFLASQAKVLTQKLEFLGALQPLILFTLKYAPYCIMWGLFTFLYMFLPNTKVRWQSALFAGILAGTVYQIVQWVYITFQVGVAEYNAIYGSFAALPLLLAWLQISWLIVLAGAEVSQAHQNADFLEFGPDAERVSPAFRKTLALWVANRVCRNFTEPGAPLTAAGLHLMTGIPHKLLAAILSELTECGILAEVSAERPGEAGFQPAVDPDRLTIAYVLDALDRRGTDDIPILRTEALEELSASLREFEKMLREFPSNRLLKAF
ncbi:MAG: YihY family inner membrane protein [Syntrophaceae bacterium]|nr:YihY family inner membrane protein [Syntrophaceae bacterium]